MSSKEEVGVAFFHTPQQAIVNMARTVDESRQNNMNNETLRLPEFA